MRSNLYSFEEAAKKIGYPSYRKLFSMCKELEIIDHERWPVAPWKYLGLFEVREVKTANSNFNVNQTFVTEKGIVFLSGVIVGTRKTSKTVRSTDTVAKNSTGTAGSADKITRPSA